MEKTGVVASLGESQLLRPAWTRAALAANDRLKLYLTVLQTAQSHAAQPAVAPLNLTKELAAAHVADAAWLGELPTSSYAEGSVLHVPGLARLRDKLRADLELMARPLQGDPDPLRQALIQRTGQWTQWLDAQSGDTLSREQIKELASGNRQEKDSFHILVMDLHKALLGLTAEFSGATIEGAHAWQLGPGDEAKVAAFMRGLNRTRPLKFDHPGLDTAATRDGDRLLIQNDIGTNDAHVLVVTVRPLAIELTYSDLHKRRFVFFRDCLAAKGAVWSGIALRTTSGLNADDAYQIGTATFTCPNDIELLDRLEFLGSRIVFLIDWNRARKRLNLFVGKAAAIQVLSEAAQRDVGHMGWLAAGGERLVYGAMQALGAQYFRIGERLDHVVGETLAIEFLVETLTLASHAALVHQPVPLIADAVRLLLLRYCRRHRDEFDLLNEHAAYCHALGEGLRDAVAHGHDSHARQAAAFAERAKTWERQADLLVVKSRELARSRPGWVPFVEIIEPADDVADALEEAAFLLSLIAENDDRRWHAEVRGHIVELAEATLAATQDYIRALNIAQSLGEASRAEDQDEFIATSWRVLNAERQCDNLLREVRRALARHVGGVTMQVLSTDFASALEQATDALLVATYRLRELAFSRLGAKA